MVELTEKSFKKLPSKGPAAASIGNACIFILGNMKGKDGLGALSRLKLKVGQNNTKKLIDKYLHEGAIKHNVSVSELVEMAVPDFKLKNGAKSVMFDDYILHLNISENKVSQTWENPAGKSIKSVPSVVKQKASLKTKLAKCRKEIKEIQKVVSAQKQRIDNLLILAREWSYDSFQKYYIDHGLVMSIASKLIWTFKSGNKEAHGILIDHKWVDNKGEIIDWIDETTSISLWHPIYHDEKEIVEWREFIIQKSIKQPIKQAFREIYIVTDAEINTRTYSNRMASHILKQHQFSALAKIRDWKYSLMGSYDDGIDNAICSKELKTYNLKAEYWIDELNDLDAINDSGIWNYVSTDQVKFLNEKGETLVMTDVPAIVFSEIMRDVDLFVGVCSVGNDPEWQDNNGHRQTYRNYWQNYSFGDLNEIAKTRKQILERLLPRLNKLKGKAHIDGKFLIVQGTLRTYKIHIGSTNILMTPNDQYLCIVPDRSPKSTNGLFIPFEGDSGLSIVLSKAFLLAEDNKIKDSTITRQINRN